MSEVGSEGAAALGRREGVEAPMLTTNDLASCQTAIALAVAWYKSKPPCGFNRAEVRKLQDLYKRLEGAVEHKNPYFDSDDIPDDFGNDPIYGPLP